ncbi:MAG: holo-ACP synthase [Clostridium sp.]|jgi:holo-[acyl-carrier protein] synthase|nr:holo-ACP synthase [Clostridium sp.]
MIIGVGTDLVEMDRMKKACGRESFLKRIYTEEERRQAGKRISRLAGDFAVKEAVAKTLGTGFRDFGPECIEALRDPLGKPYVRLFGRAKELAAELGIDMFHVSVTNTARYAAAFVVGEGNGPGDAKDGRSGGLNGDE